MSPVNIFWFRRDLRLDDNAGLYHALKEGLPVIPLFIFDRNILDDLDNRHDLRVEFIHRAIHLLQSQLVKLGATLEVRYGFPGKIFTDLVKEYQVKRREFNKLQDDLEKKAQANGDTNFKKQTMSAHYFTMMKQLTILGYFTSKEGRQGATNYQPVPGKYEGDVPYRKGIDKIVTGLS